MTFDIIKNSGETESYSFKKLCTSLEKAGAPKHVAERICVEVEAELAPGASTTKIYRESLRRLLKESIEVSARYSLRRGIDALGPAGFLFEQFVEALLQVHDYQTKRNVMMKGECATHEVDIYAKKGDQVFLVEARLRNNHNIKTHIDQVMYADARLMDIQRRVQALGKKIDYTMWVITNTKFTHNAIRYAECRGVKLVGWNYPRKENLETMIVRKKMYPITVLPSLTVEARDMFAGHNMILAQDILPYPAEDLYRKMGIPLATAKKLVQEAHSLIA